MYDCHQLCLIGVTYCSSCAAQRILARASFAEPRRDLKEHGDRSRPRPKFNPQYDDDGGAGDSCENHVPTPSLEEVFNASVRVMGENSRGSTEKMVLPNGTLSVLKRFWASLNSVRESRDWLKFAAAPTISCRSPLTYIPGGSSLLFVTITPWEA
ncbi:hypothetical protein F3Y22_tig00110788pilonHSYRG00024 [Hibiscus syriacus]|uniref:Uncharacterized protein n=1 Tax=Hibiscus syriacus TaxID=106335 RepID=A0A6A2ZQ49_HIBSY|nr:hypothetical protein F3Y22_tig00110788pilonHSYRG00024 [Hibiscus syriacus]